MHDWNAFSHLAWSSPLRVVPTRHASRLDEQDEKSGCCCDRNIHWALATVVIAIRAAGSAAATVILSMARSSKFPRSRGLPRPPPWQRRRQVAVKHFRVAVEAISKPIGAIDSAAPGAVCYALDGMGVQTRKRTNAKRCGARDCGGGVECVARR